MFAQCYACASLREECAMGKWMLGVAAAALMAGEAPADLIISNKPTANVNCAGGVCTATAQNAVLNAGDLANLLAADDVKVATGGGATNIAVKAPLSWTSASRLTFDANQSVEIDKPVSVTGSGAVTIATNDGGSGGDLIFDGKGVVTFWDTASSLVIDGNSYTLVKDIATLAADIAGNPSGFYALASDYDASKDGTYAASPISTTFGGTFEGLGHKIEHVSINSSENLIGLFSLVTGTIRDIGIIGLAISGSSSGVAGGLLAQSKLATVVDCYTTGSINLPNIDGVGGLIGAVWFTQDGSVARSHSSVSVVAPKSSAAGGLVGSSGLAISLSYASGSIQAGDGASAGGLAGEATGIVSQSFATGNVSAGENSSVGGLVGAGTLGVDNSYARGSVKGGKSASVGGLVGQAVFSFITSSYSTGRVAGGKAHITVGGFAGVISDGGSYASDYWDVNTSGRGKRDGVGSCDVHCRRAIKGLTTQQFQAGLPVGFDASTWAEKADVNAGYPYLIAVPSK